MRNLGSGVLFSMVLVLFFLSGCGEPDREQYRDMAAEDVCTEAEGCDNLDGLYGSSYSSLNSCILGEQNRFENMWPEDRCGDDRIDPEQYDRCIVRARLAACGNVADILSALNECSADKVCRN